MARLPSADQRWILRRLSKTEHQTLKRWNGLTLLRDAQRFRALKINDLHLPPAPTPTILPACCLELAAKTPLYAAIIIEQGNYSWAAQFLDECDPGGAIQAALENQVQDLKPIVKQAVCNEWEQSISFVSLLDDAHG